MLSRGKRLGSWNISWRWRWMCMKINTATAICLICFTQLTEWDRDVFSISTSRAIWRLYEITLSQSLVTNQAPSPADPNVSVTFLNASVKGRVELLYISVCLTQGTLPAGTSTQTDPSTCTKSCWNQWKSTSATSQERGYFLAWAAAESQEMGCFPSSHNSTMEKK